MRFQVRYTRRPIGINIRSKSGCSMVIMFLSLRCPIAFSAYAFGDFSFLLLESYIALLHVLLQSFQGKGHTVGCRRGAGGGKLRPYSPCPCPRPARCGSL